MKVTIATTLDAMAGAWWSAARGTKGAPRELRALLAGKATMVDVSPERARAIRGWCATVAGWDPDAAPLSFEGLVGRPPSPRRGAGASRVTVWLAVDERRSLEALASTRGQTLADVLRTSALVEARREESRPENAGSEVDADAVAVEAIAAGDLIYTDAGHVPRGRPERVLAVRREQDLWCVDLAGGVPLWFASGATVWKKHRRPHA